jgi:hypothetical protein
VCVCVCMCSLLGMKCGRQSRVGKGVARQHCVVAMVACPHMYILLRVHAPKRPFFRIPIPSTSRYKIVQIMLSHSLLPALLMLIRCLNHSFAESCRRCHHRVLRLCVVWCGVCMCALARRSVPWGRDVGGSPVYWIRTAQFLHVFCVCFWWDSSVCQPLCAPHTGCCCCCCVVVVAALTPCLGPCTRPCPLL